MQRMIMFQIKVLKFQQKVKYAEYIFIGACPGDNPMNSSKRVKLYVELCFFILLPEHFGLHQQQQLS